MFNFQLMESDQKITSKSKLPDRSTIEKVNQWDIRHIFSTDEDWERGYTKLEKQLQNFEKFQGKLRESAETLLKYLKLRDKIDVLLGQLYLYAGLKNDEDTTVSKYQGYRDRVTALSVQTSEKTAFFRPEILSISQDRLYSFLQKTSELKIYIHYFEDLLRFKPYTLPHPEELILAMSGEIGMSPYNIFSMFNNADIKFPTILDENEQEIEVTKGRYNKLMESQNRRVRNEAFNALYKTYANWTNTLAASLSGAVKKNIFYARSRKYKSALEASLHTDNIPKTVYKSVVNSINHHLSPFHKYMNLRKNILKLESLKPWDLSVPLFSDIKFEIPFEEAKETLFDALKPLGNQYVSILREGFNNNWIDIYENQGKRSGAYSWSTHGIHPYILLNYNNTLDDMFTLAHEMGHALHSHFTHKTQPVIYSGYNIFVAEVASTLNEALLMGYLLKKTEDKNKKLYLLNQYADQIKGTVYTQTLFAEFEKIIHEKAEAGEPLTAEYLSNLNKELYAQYMGPSFSNDSNYEINWCRIPHFYYNFYVYKYVTGFSAATVLSQRIIAGDKTARRAYIEFLSCGCSDYAINLLMDAGVDMGKSEPIEETTKLLDNLVNEIETLSTVK